MKISIRLASEMVCTHSFPSDGFCSHARRIETQDVLFGEENIDRLIEVGPANTLAAMAKKTLAAKYSISDAARPRKREILCHQTDAEQIYQEVNETIIKFEKEEKSTAKESKPIPAAAPPIQHPEAPAPAPPPRVLDIPDVPISAGDTVIAIVSSKLKKSFQEINGTQTIKILTGGK